MNKVFSLVTLIKVKNIQILLKELAKDQKFYLKYIF